MSGGKRIYGEAGLVIHDVSLQESTRKSEQPSWPNRVARAMTRTAARLTLSSLAPVR
jgi:hypothetical protein